MYSGRILPASSDWFRAAVRIVGNGVYRSTIWPHKIIVAEAGRAGSHLIEGQVNTSQILLVGGWFTQFGFAYENCRLDVVVDDCIIGLRIDPKGSWSRLILNSDGSTFSSEILSIETDYAVTKGYFSFSCEETMAPSVIGSMHLAFAIISRYRFRRVTT